MTVSFAGLENNQKLRVEFAETVRVPQEYGLVDSSPIIKFMGTVQRSGDEYLLDGSLESDISIPCGKCLTPVKHSVRTPVFERFSSQNVGEDEEVWHIASNANVDIMPAVLLNLLLNIPMSVSCGGDCKGLCRYCGANLNTQSCNCNELNREIDPRLEKLKDFI